MTKLEYIKLKQELINTYGKPVYNDIDHSPVNESAKKLKELLKTFQSEQRTKYHDNRKQLLDDKEQQQIIKDYKHKQAVPITLSQSDLDLFRPEEQKVVISYFQDTNQTPTDLHQKHKDWSTQGIVALMRSGPFAIVAARVFEYLMPLEVRNAALKAIRDGDKRLIERFAEQTGVLKNQAMDLNINKPIEDAILSKKLKEIGDSAI